MIDFHSHILPNIDDGSRGMEETLNLIQEAKEVGFTQIISTSHYMEDYCEANESERKEVLNYVQKQVNDIELFLGSEIYISNEMVSLLQEKEASTINHSRYVLFELPMNMKPFNGKEIVYRLIENGYIPIIAHPERYHYVQKDMEYVKELSEMGALFQSNYGSIVGWYGKDAEKTMKKLLKEDVIHFLGSDVHRVNHTYTIIPKALKKLRKIISEEKLEELTTINAQKVLNDEEIE